MRPGGDLLGQRPRRDIEIAPPGVPTNHATPTSFFIASEHMLENESPEDVGDVSESTFGVESLQETVFSERLKDDGGKNDREGRNNNKHENRRRSTLKPATYDQDSCTETNKSTSQHRVNDGSPSDTNFLRTSPPSVSESLTSLSQASQLQGISPPGSPKSNSTRSFRHSDEESTDETGSQAIVSSGEDDNEYPSEIIDSSPQLIMPSIKMPSRRPFTDRGKCIGRLKILIAGDSGVGKTSLIKSIVQICDDIVHVDPLTPNLPSIDQLRQRKSTGRREKRLNPNSTDQITEVYASTRAYPPWWSDIEESKIFGRRKSMGDTVLERNLCFVDTPGYSHKMSTKECINLVVNYVEAQSSKASSFASMDDGELVSILSGKGGTQVDLVFYLIAQVITPQDLSFIRQLSDLTNVIPLIAKADFLSQDEAQSLKMSITSELQSAQIKSFMFNPHESAPSPPYTICSKSSNDDDNMDASLLMSQDYVQPLIPSELSALVHQVLDKENVSCLRYLSAKKLIHFQKRFQAAFVPTSFPDLPATSYPLQSRFSTYPVSPINSSGSSQAILSYTSGASSFVQARLADHTQREEKLAQIRLAKWASDLQRCLHNERTQYESISRGERAVWLTQRLAECVGNGSLIPLRGSSTDTPSPSGKATQAMKSRPMDHSAYYSYMNVRDPLGLLGWNETMRKRGWIAIQVVGSFGVLGAMAIWIARSWSNSSDAYAGWNFGRWIGKA